MSQHLVRLCGVLVAALSPAAEQLLSPWAPLLHERLIVRMLLSSAPPPPAGPLLQRERLTSPPTLAVRWMVACLASAAEWLHPLCLQATAKEQSIRITSSGGLSDDQIERMVREGEENAAKDKEVGDCKADHECSTTLLRPALPSCWHPASGYHWPAAQQIC